MAAQRVIEADCEASCTGRSTVLFACSPSGTLVAVGAALDGLPGKPASTLVHPSSVDRLDAALQDVRDGAASGATTLRLACCSGLELSVSWSVLTGGCPDSTQVVFVGAAPAARRPFRPSLRLQEAVDRLSREVAVVADADGALLYASPGVTAVLGYAADSNLPADIWGTVHPDDAPSVRAGLRAVVEEEEPRTATLRIRGAAGDWRWVELAAVSLRDDAIGGVACALHDITAEVEAKQALRAAEARFRAFADMSGDGVCMVGLGGETLYANARLTEILGMPMSAAYYVELMCTLDGAQGPLETTYAHPDGSARRLRVAATPLSAADGSPEGTLVVVADVPAARDGLTPQPESGDVDEQDVLAADLCEALADDALRLEYQPVVDLRSGAVVGMEALARWAHPRRGDVPPTSFVAVAERTGLAPRLDRWVVRRALGEMAALRQAGVVPEDAYIAVNLSACSVADTFVVEDLVSWTEESGLPPGQVVLEITETAIMHNTESAIRLLRRLRDHGFRVAMDDFGTGYSSLAYLRDLPISALKIDRSFVDDIAEQAQSRAIVATVVELARAVGAAVVAEGVETAIQAAILHRLGVVTAQGWLWSQAVPPTELLARGRWATPLASASQATASAWAQGDADGGVAHGLRRLFELHQAGASPAAIAQTLNSEGLRTPAGRRWHRGRVERVLAQRIRRCGGAPETSPGFRRPGRHTPPRLG